jgi:hypothetical protein
VAKVVRRIVMERLDETARRLLREMGYQAEDNPTRLVLPEEAAQNIALDIEAPEYEAALTHLLALGDIERERRDPAFLLPRQARVRFASKRSETLWGT